MHRIELQSSYILHTRPYRETSLLLEVFTLDFGRIGVIAKGVKRPNAKTRGLLQPFIPLLISCAGRGELLTLKNFDLGGVIGLLSGRRLISAFYLNELLMRLLHRWDTNSDLFLSYSKALADLTTAKQEQIVLRLFEKSLLKALGYELQLTHEVATGREIEEDKFYIFDPERGPILSESINQKIGGSHHLFKGKSLLALDKEKLNDISVLWDIKRLMRDALAPHLGFKPLESRKLL